MDLVGDEQAAAHVARVEEDDTVRSGSTLPSSRAKNAMGGDRNGQHDQVGACHGRGEIVCHQG